MPENPSNPDIAPPPLPMASDSVYFNGFGIALTAGDVVVTLIRNGNTVLNLNGSYTVMKSLSAGLEKAVTELEALMSHKIMTVEEISNVMIAKMSPQK
jgi:hypothetical protein